MPVPQQMQPGRLHVVLTVGVLHLLSSMPEIEDRFLITIAIVKYVSYLPLISYFFINMLQ